MIIRIVNVLLVLFILICSGFHNNEKKIPIFLEEYDYEFTPQKTGCSDTLFEKLEDGRELKIILFGCTGKLHIVCYKGKMKSEEGDYIASLDLLKRYINVTNGITGKTVVRVSAYYQPLRSGVWSFYDTKGRLRNKKVYKEGILE